MSQIETEEMTRGLRALNALQKTDTHMVANNHP